MTPRIFPLGTYLLIGFCQCLAMVPGVSRSGATIVSAMLLGADRRAAAEFSFYLAMPTMAGAFAYELYKSWHEISAASPAIVAIGFVVSFISAWVVVKSFLDFVSSHGFARVRLVAHRGRRGRVDCAGADGLGDASAELSGLAETPQIARHDRFHGGRLDPERRNACGRRQARPAIRYCRFATARPGPASAAASA